MRSDVIPGAIFPDYELSDHTAKRRKLSELQGQHPMVLVLSRGGFCPKDRRQAEGLLELHREMEVGYCRLVTISTDNITETNEYRSGVGAHWPFLSDTRRIVQKDLDIAEYTDPTHNPMIPHVIVLEPGLVIYKIYNGYWFFGRPTLEDLRQDLRAVTKKCRPDWDITTPELKAAWQQGRKELFYPYGKTYVQTIGDKIVVALPSKMHAPGNRRVLVQADQNTEIRRTAMGKRTSQGRLHSDRSCPKTSKETSNADDWLFYRRRFYAFMLIIVVSAGAGPYSLDALTLGLMNKHVA